MARRGRGAYKKPHRLAVPPLPWPARAGRLFAIEKNKKEPPARCTTSPMASASRKLFSRASWVGTIPFKSKSRANRRFGRLFGGLVFPGNDFSGAYVHSVFFQNGRNPSGVSPAFAHNASGPCSTFERSFPFVFRLRRRACGGSGAAWAESGLIFFSRPRP